MRRPDAHETLGWTALTALLIVVLLSAADVFAGKVDSPPTTPRPSAAPSNADGAGAGAPDRQLRILSIMTIDTMSHHIWMAPLTQGLAKRGHLVTSVDVVMPKNIPPTLNVSVIETAFNPNQSAITQAMMSAGLFTQIKMVVRFTVLKCESDLAAPSVARLIDPAYEGKFDLILVDYLSDCQLGFAHRFKAPMIVVSPFPGSSWIDSLMGGALLPGLLHHAMAYFPHPMSLWQRASSVFISSFFNVQNWWNGPECDRILKDSFGPDTPGVEELRNSVALAFVNENPVLDPARPFPPSIIPVGGIHVKPADLNNIPADLRAWLDAAKDGFIFMSFGSIVRLSSLDKEKLDIFIESFRELREVRILWKVDANVLDEYKGRLPSNLRVEKWLPQNDLLSHPNMALFVSHCGGLSTGELAHHGVPVLCTPFFMDQLTNAGKMTRIGMGRSLLPKDINKELFLSEIREMLSNPTYRANAQKTAELLRDQKETPLERAIWWSEYVARHHGAPHLRSPLRDYSLPQILLLDTFALIALVILTVNTLVVLVLRGCLRCLCRRGKESTRIKKD